MIYKQFEVFCYFKVLFSKYFVLKLFSIIPNDSSILFDFYLLVSTSEQFTFYCYVCPLYTFFLSPMKLPQNIFYSFFFLFLFYLSLSTLLLPLLSAFLFFQFFLILFSDESSQSYVFFHDNKMIILWEFSKLKRIVLNIYILKRIIILTSHKDNLDNFIPKIKQKTS